MNKKELENRIEVLEQRLSYSSYDAEKVKNTPDGYVFVIYNKHAPCKYFMKTNCILNVKQLEELKEQFKNINKDRDIKCEIKPRFSCYANKRLDGSNMDFQLKYIGYVLDSLIYHRLYLKNDRSCFVNIPKYADKIAKALAKKYSQFLTLEKIQTSYQDRNRALETDCNTIIFDDVIKLLVEKCSFCPDEKDINKLYIKFNPGTHGKYRHTLMLVKNESLIKE